MENYFQKDSMYIEHYIPGKLLSLEQYIPGELYSAEKYISGKLIEVGKYIPGDIYGRQHNVRERRIFKGAVFSMTTTFTSAIYSREH
jgi:hypothetical protein